MNITDFVKKIIEEYNLKIDVTKTLDYIKNKARKEATNGVACIDDDTVKEWILNGVDEINKCEFKEVIKAREESEEVKEVVKPIVKVKKEKGKEYEEISLFD